MCVSLLSLFDFRGDKRVTRQDWVRGTRALTLNSLGEDDALWELLLQKFDTRREGWVDLTRIEDLVPIDPRISMLMKAMFNSVTTLSDGMLRAQGKMETGETLRKNRVVINLRKRLIRPPFSAWSEYVMKTRSLRLRTVKRTQRGIVMAWNQWCEVADERRRLQKFMRRALNGAVTNAWYKWQALLEDQGRMAKFVRRIMNRALAAAFSSWEDMIHERKRMQRFMVSTQPLHKLTSECLQQEHLVSHAPCELDALFHTDTSSSINFPLSPLCLQCCHGCVAFACRRSAASSTWKGRCGTPGRDAATNCAPIAN